MSGAGERDHRRPARALRSRLMASLAGPALALALGCPAGSTPAPAVGPSSEPSAAASPRAPTDELDLRARAGPDLPADTKPGAVPSTDPLTERGAHPCEQSCAEVHDCAARIEPGGPAAAATIELGCLAACVGVPPSNQRPLFGCASPAPLDARTCEPYLACVEGAWPGPRTEAPVPAEPPPPGRGCELACEAFAACHNPTTDPENVQRCVSRCEQTLTAEQERALGACTTLPRCEEIERCVLDTPGA